MSKIRRRNNRFIILATIFLFLFFITTLFVLDIQGELFDEMVALWATDLTNPIFLNSMHVVSLIGSSEIILIVTVLVGIVLLFKRKWRPFFFFFIVSVGGVVLNFILKNVIKRARPGEEESYIEAFNMQLDIQSYSFPSGHTMRATILFLFLIYLAYLYIENNGLKWASYIISVILLLLIAFSRIVLDAHFVTDVIGALFIATAWYFICLYFFYEPRRRRSSIFF